MSDDYSTLTMNDMNLLLKDFEAEDHYSPMPRFQTIEKKDDTLYIEDIIGAMAGAVISSTTSPLLNYFRTRNDDFFLDIDCT
jgi:hypothetical protein